MISNARVRELINFALSKCGMDSSFSNRIRFEWNDRFTSRAGDADYGKMLIRLSKPLFKRATIKDQEETVIHEACHLIAMKKFGTRTKPHGGKWKAYMLMCGIEPDRCHSIDRTGLKRTQKIFTTDCYCGAHMVTAKVYVRVAKGEIYACDKCNAILSIPKEQK